MKSWPSVASRSTYRTHEQVEEDVKQSEMKFWRKLATSWGGLMGRKDTSEDTSSVSQPQSSLGAETVSRGEQVHHLINQNRITVCSDCAMDLGHVQDASPFYRGINISSSSVCSMENNPEFSVGKKKTEENSRGKFSQFKKIFSLPNSPEKTAVTKRNQS